MFKKREFEYLIQEDALIYNKYKEEFDISKFPYEIESVDTKLNAELLKYFKGERTGFVKVGPKKWLFPSGYAREAANYYNFQVRPDDVFVATFPRSGTTWVQAMVWLLANDLNFEKADTISLLERFPFLEFSSFVHPQLKSDFLSENSYDPEKYQKVIDICSPAWKALEKVNEKRFIKTHLPFSLLPPDLLNVGCKVIYVARNPKDVAVSFYHLNRLIRTQGYTGDFPKYWDYFERNLQPWTPYWEHIKEGWENRNNKNVLFIFYENLNKNIREGIQQIATFLGKSYTTEQLEQLEDHLNIANFRQNKTVNFDELKNSGILINGEENFVRQGKNGGWGDYFDEKLNSRADRWIEENLKNIPGFKFPTK